MNRNQLKSILIIFIIIFSLNSLIRSVHADWQVVRTLEALGASQSIFMVDSEDG